MNLQHVLDAVQIRLGIQWYGVFLLSIVLHEFAHALVAYLFGDRTAYEAGQVTLNPIPHMQRERMGTIFVPILSFILGGFMIGWASAPFNVNWALRNKNKSVLMALAGPAMNLLLAIVAVLFIRLGFAMGVFLAPESLNFSHVTEAAIGGMWGALATMISILFSLNLILAVFNMLPFPGFDGSSLFLLFVDGERAEKLFFFIHHPGYIIFSVIIAWNIFMYVFHPIHDIAINLLYPGVGYD